MAFNYSMAEWHEILPRGVFPSAPVSIGRFAGFDGEQITVAGAPALGVYRGSLTTADIGFSRGVTVIILGFATMEAGGGFNPGDILTSDNQGRPIVRGAGQSVNAVAFEKANQAGDQALVLVLHQIKPVASAAIADLGTAGTSTVAQLEAKINAILAQQRAQGLLAP